MDILFLFVLILLNGVFAMSEMAVVASRKTRLEQWAGAGRAGARAALRLTADPSHFLSTIQVGITAIGIMSGILGDAVLARPIAEWLARFPVVAPYATGVAVALVLVSITALSLVFGELVPKRLALHRPEAIASVMARPMAFLSLATYPLVRLLSVVTEAIVSLFGAAGSGEPPVTEAEIHALMDQGRAAGVFDVHEQDIVRRAFALDDVRVSTVMTPRRALAVVQLDDDAEEVRRTIRENGHSRFPVVDDTGEIVGLLRARMVVEKLLSGERADTASSMEKALFVPHSLTLTRLLELFRKSLQKAAIVVDEYGHAQGMVTLNDVLTALVGDIGVVDQDEDPPIVRRADGSWLMSGSLGIEGFRQATAAQHDLPDEGKDSFDTLGGLAMNALQRIPKVGDRFETEEFDFEVVDMDLHRVDKVLVTQKPPMDPRGNAPQDPTR